MGLAELAGEHVVMAAPGHGGGEIHIELQGAAEAPEAAAGVAMAPLLPVREGTPRTSSGAAPGLRTASRVLTGALAATMGYGFFNNDLFSVHPILMAAGYLLFMSEGVMAAVRFRKREGGDRVAAIWLHAFTMGFALLSVAGGFAAIYANNIRKGSPHFTTLHGKLGVGAVALTLMSAAGGAVSFRRLGLLQRFGHKTQLRIKQLHRALGPVAYFLALAALYLGISYPKRRTRFTVAWQLGTVAAGALAGVSLRTGRA